MLYTQRIATPKKDVVAFLEKVGENKVKLRTCTLRGGWTWISHFGSATVPTNFPPMPEHDMPNMLLTTKNFSQQLMQNRFKMFWYPHVGFKVRRWGLLLSFVGLKCCWFTFCFCSVILLQLLEAAPTSIQWSYIYFLTIATYSSWDPLHRQIVKLLQDLSAPGWAKTL